MKTAAALAALAAAGLIFLGWRAKKAAEKVHFYEGEAWGQVETMDEICEPRDFFSVPEGGFFSGGVNS